MFHHSVMHTTSSQLTLIRSRSSYLVADDDRQRAITAAVEALTRRLPERFELPYLTRASRVFKTEPRVA